MQTVTMRTCQPSRRQLRLAVSLLSVSMACRQGAAEKPSAPEAFPTPPKASRVEFDQDADELRFETSESIVSVVDFYRPVLEDKGWECSFDQVASIFANVYYRSGGRTIAIKISKPDIFKPKLEVIIEGAGQAWAISGAKPPAPAHSAPAQRKRLPELKGSQLPLLDAQSTSRSGDLELIQFRSRRSVDQNHEHFAKLLAKHGWKETPARNFGETRSLRYEKDGRYIRVGLWPERFSDNAGEHQGASGAVEGTGLRWSDEEPSGAVAERQVRDAERFLGRMSDEKREQLKTMIRVKREAAFWPPGKMPRWAAEGLPAPPDAAKPVSLQASP